MKEVRNRNAQRSVRMLEEAYVELLAEKKPEKITVTDITRRADLNRGTFYAHFDDINDLETSLMDELFERLTIVLSQIMDTSFLENPRPILDSIGEFLEENRQIISRLLETKNLLPISVTIERRLREQVRHILLEKYPDSVPDVYFTADYVSGGILHAYEEWLLGDYGDVSMAEINDFLVKIIRTSGEVFDAHA